MRRLEVGVGRGGEHRLGGLGDQPRLPRAERALAQLPLRGTHEPRVRRAQVGRGDGERQLAHGGAQVGDSLGHELRVEGVNDGSRRRDLLRVERVHELLGQVRELRAIEVRRAAQSRAARRVRRRAELGRGVGLDEGGDLRLAAHVCRVELGA